jgi:photosystem II stability/assembly factor-like uncharacterized protein
MRRFGLMCLCTSCFGFGHAQVRPDCIPVNDQTPEFVVEMQKPEPNVFEVERAWRDYHKRNLYVKNSQTQYYKRWMHWAQRNMDNNGWIRVMPSEEGEREALRRREERRSAKSALRTAPDWKFVGPSRTFHTDGQTKVTWQTNIYCIDVAKSDPGVLYAGGETGGIWKTEDKGMNWELKTPDILHGSFDAIAIHPANHDTAYASTSGKMIKTTDGGNTWTTIYSESGWNCYDIEIHAANPRYVFAAGNKGLLYSRDGGKNWSRQWPDLCWTLQSGVADPDVVFCVRKRGNSSELMSTTNAGLSWNSTAANWYQPDSGIQLTGAILAVCPSNAKKIYAYLCGQGEGLHGYIGIFVSEDGGQSWENTHPGKAIGAPYSIPGHTNLMAHNGTDGFDQGFYDMAIVVNPNNENELVAGGTSWFKSRDGGKSWTALGSYVGGLPWSHPDLQCLAVSGNDLWIGSDGGLNYSQDFAASMETRMDGISGADLWGFDAGWNEDILVGGRYHNGNMAWHEHFPEKTFFRMGGAEAPTGYVSPGPGRKVYFSDIGGYRLNGDLQAGVSYFPVGLFPNESYAYYANSQMCWHPNCWNIVYLGREQNIWKSEDGGGTFQLLHRFPGNEDNRVFEIEISRSHPDVMYCSQWDGTDDAMWNSRDGGKSWTRLTALPLPNNNDRVKMTLSNLNPDQLWVSVSYGSNGKKVFHSQDGGKSWVNLTTALLDNVRISDILHAHGTNGGVYLGTNRGVYYRNATMADWIPYSTGLPLSAETNRLKPFYKEGKLRNGCWGFGVWETEMFEESAVQAKIMTDKLQSNCLKDTFYFDDHSVVRHANAEWSWSFDDANYIHGANTRSSQVVFRTTGRKLASLKITTPSGVYRDSLYVEVGDACEKDSLPGYALYLDGNGGYAQAPSLDRKTNAITMMAWVKSTAAQDDWAGILFTRGGGQAAGLSVLSNGDIRYHWNSGGYNWNSGANLEQNEWTHLAMVAEPGGITIYKNGRPYRHAITTNEHSFVSPLAIGADLNGGDRFFKGNIDEVCIYDRSLSQTEIRESMHLAKTHSGIPGLDRYYQFNESSGHVMDRQGISHATLNANAQRVLSTAPAGPGASQQWVINAAASYDFDSAGVKLTTANNATYPDGEVWITRINYIPEANFNPSGQPVVPSYWILRPYGANERFSSFSEMTFKEVGRINQGSVLSDYTLFRRAPNADTAVWVWIDTAMALNNGPESRILFGETHIQQECQLLITKSWNDTLVVGQHDFGDLRPNPYADLFPNPAEAGEPVFLRTNLEGEVSFSLYDHNGRRLRKLKFIALQALDLKNLPAGSYFGIFETRERLFCRSLIIAD